MTEIVFNEEGLRAFVYLIRLIVAGVITKGLKGCDYYIQNKSSIINMTFDADL